MTQAATIEPTASPAPATSDFLPLQGIDHVEFYVGNAHQSAHFYRTMFGFDITAYRGLETGDASGPAVVEQGKIRFVLTTARRPDHEVGIATHGDGVKVIALAVNDVDASIEAVKERGRHPLPPQTLRTPKANAMPQSARTARPFIRSSIRKLLAYSHRFRARDSGAQGKMGWRRLIKLVAC
jgi:4-hydroxyphenylpyruvate dioxygenase